MFVVGCGFKTTYAPQYDEDRFKSIQLGESLSQVVKELGQPLSKHPVWMAEEWLYPSKNSRFVLTYAVFGPEHIYDDPVCIAEKIDPARADGPSLAVGASAKEILLEYGEPEAKLDSKRIEGWSYSESPTNGNYKLRVVYIDLQSERVVAKDAVLYWD